MNEDDIADVYEDYLGQQNDKYLSFQVVFALDRILKPMCNHKLEDYEREQLTRMIQNLDNTGRYDPGFEDLRKSVSTNDSCG